MVQAGRMEAVVQPSVLLSDNPTVEEALSVFCEVYIVERHFAEATKRGYRYDLSEWMKHLAEQRVKRLNIRVLQRYVSHLSERGLRDSTCERKIAALTTFLRFLEEQGVPPTALSSSLVWPKVERKEPRPLSPTQYRAILNEAATNPRDLAMLETMLQTGIRLHELTAITLENITLPDYPIIDPITGYGVLRIKRKKGRLAEIVVNYKAARAIQAYLAVRPVTATNALFLNKFGKGISNRGVEKAFKHYAFAAGIPWAHVESLRTTHIVEHLARKTDTQIVAGNAGLSEQQATHYAQFVKKEHIKAMQENAL